jgi:hypothetical protein
MRESLILICLFVDEMQVVVVSQGQSLISLERLQENTRKQFETERKGTVTIKSIEKKDNLENLAHYVRTLKISFAYRFPPGILYSSPCFFHLML